jgi:preprotein translocase subunit SecY
MTAAQPPAGEGEPRRRDPAIFASSLLLAADDADDLSRAGQRPGDVDWILANFGPGQPLYLLFFASMIIFFTYFYT